MLLSVVMKIDCKKIIYLYQSGNSPSNIVKQTKISKTSVYRILAKQGFGRDKTQLSNKTKDKIISLYLSGIGARSICDRVGLDRNRKNVVYKILKEKGIEIRKKTVSPLKAIIPKIQNLYQEGYGCTTISKKLKISKSTATKYIQKHCNVRPQKKPTIRCTRERDRLFLSELDYFNRVAYCAWYVSDRRIPLEDFKQSAYASAIRAAELWLGKATYRTYAVKCINFGFLKLYKENPVHLSIDTTAAILKSDRTPEQP